MANKTSCETDRDPLNSSFRTISSHSSTRQPWNLSRLLSAVNDETSLTLFLPKNLIGSIIGPNGCIISRIQKETGAYIALRKSEDSNLSKIEIYASEETRIKTWEYIETQLKYGIRYTHSPLTISTPTNWNEYLLLLQQEKDRNEKLAEEYPLIKNIYREHPDTARMTFNQANEWRKVNDNIMVTNIFECDYPITSTPNPVTTFHQAFFSYPEIIKGILKQGFYCPSPIQSQAWPILLSGHDMISIAQVGMGKTLAFLLPALIHIDQQPIPRHQRNGPNVLIMVATRELALQIKAEINKFNYRGIRSVCIYGGANRTKQIDICASGVQIVIATPGRLMDLVDSNHINIELVTYLVLDDVDRMIEMGFESLIHRSLFRIRSDRQSLVTSGTWSGEVRKLVMCYVKDPFIITSGELAIARSIIQKLIFLDSTVKFETFLTFLNSLTDTEKVIVFCRRETAILISTKIFVEKIHHQRLYSGLKQYDRERAVREVNDGTVRILITTDIASRGLNFNKVTHVVNYDLPFKMENYIHRIGRTGRGGIIGKAISYVTPFDLYLASDFVQVLKRTNYDVPSELICMANRYKLMREVKHFRGHCKKRR